MTTTKIVVVRHGAAASSPLGDLYRDLTPEGIAEVRELGRALNSELAGPVTVFVSPAARACDTWNNLQEELVGIEPDVHKRSEIYEGEAEDLISLVRHEAQGAATVLIVGHEPAISMVPFILGDKDSMFLGGMPTASAVILESEDGTWGNHTISKIRLLHPEPVPVSEIPESPKGFFSKLRNWQKKD